MESKDNKKVKRHWEPFATVYNITDSHKELCKMMIKSGATADEISETLGVPYWCIIHQIRKKEPGFTGNGRGRKPYKKQYLYGQERIDFIIDRVKFNVGLRELAEKYKLSLHRVGYLLVLYGHEEYAGSPNPQYGIRLFEQARKERELILGISDKEE